MSIRNSNVILVTAALLLTACNANVGDSGSSAAATGLFNSASVPRLNVLPSTASLSSYGQIQLQPTGGVAPYTYIVISGPGTVGYNSGLYVAGALSGTATVNVYDSSGEMNISTITVNGTISATTTSTATSSNNCSGIEANEYLAIEDTSSTGVADGTAENISDVTSCYTWCGSTGAAYCMWSPGLAGSSAPLCIAWPATASISYYQSSWATYSGACVGAGASAPSAVVGTWTQGALSSASAAVSCSTIAGYAEGGACVSKGTSCADSTAAGGYAAYGYAYIYTCE